MHKMRQVRYSQGREIHEYFHTQENLWCSGGSQTTTDIFQGIWEKKKPERDGGNRPFSHPFQILPAQTPGSWVVCAGRPWNGWGERSRKQTSAVPSCGWAALHPEEIACIGGDSWSLDSWSVLSHWQVTAYGHPRPGDGSLSPTLFMFCLHLCRRNSLKELQRKSPPPRLALWQTFSGHFQESLLRTPWGDLQKKLLKLPGKMRRNSSRNVSQDLGLFRI